MSSSEESAAAAAGAADAGGAKKKAWPIQRIGVRGQKAWPKYIVELMKFSCYVSIPILLIYGFGSDSEYLAKAIRNRQYIVYPPEGPRPPPPEVYFAIAKRRREIREAAEREAASSSSSSSSSSS